MADADAAPDAPATGKAGTDTQSGKRVPPLPNQDAMARISYLAQASHLVLPISAELARFYGSTLRRVAQKSVQRLHPSLKHSLCPLCDSVLDVGSTASVRIGGGVPHAVLSCVHCGYQRRFNSRADRRKLSQPQAQGQGHAQPPAGPMAPPDAPR